MNLTELKEELMKNPDFKREYERFDLWFEVQQFWLLVRSKIKGWFSKDSI